MARPPSKQPTDGELEILQILWESGPAELKTIRDSLQQERPVATTTIATMLGVMLDKGLVRRANGPRGYRWSALMSRESALRSMLGKLVDRMFDGSASLLVAHLIDDGKLSDAERKKIESLIQAHKPAKPKGETP
jgi:BlaI family transcriptional regulator, penicillinase repressor